MFKAQGLPGNIITAELSSSCLDKMRDRLTFCASSIALSPLGLLKRLIRCFSDSLNISFEIINKGCLISLNTSF